GNQDPIGGRMPYLQEDHWLKQEFISTLALQRTALSHALFGGLSICVGPIGSRRLIEERACNGLEPTVPAKRLSCFVAVDHSLRGNPGCPGADPRGAESRSMAGMDPAWPGVRRRSGAVPDHHHGDGEFPGVYLRFTAGRGSNRRRA